MIENTSDRDPLLHLLGSLGGSGRYIEEQEAAGQRQLVNSDRLPVEINRGTDAEFTALGFTFGDPDPADPLFRPASLPEGWQRQGSGHAMWSYIVDANGRRRASIFYKAAFYDRRAFMSLETPLGDVHRLLYGDITELPVDDWTTTAVWIDVLTGEIARLEASADSSDRYDLSKYAAEDREKARQLGVWLETFQQANSAVDGA